MLLSFYFVAKEVGMFRTDMQEMLLTTTGVQSGSIGEIVLDFG